MIIDFHYFAEKMQEIGRKNIKQEDIQPGSMYTLLQQPLKLCKYNKYQNENYSPVKLDKLK